MRIEQVALSCRPARFGGSIDYLAIIWRLSGDYLAIVCRRSGGGIPRSAPKCLCRPCDARTSVATAASVRRGDGEVRRRRGARDDRHRRGDRRRGGQREVAGHREIERQTELVVAGREI